jgi:hypothetical protein
MESRGVTGIPADFDAGITGALGVLRVFYHFAFEAGSEAELAAKLQTLAGKGVLVTEIVDHEWSKSFEKSTPNLSRPLASCAATEQVSSSLRLRRDSAG